MHLDYCLKQLGEKSNWEKQSISDIIHSGFWFFESLKMDVLWRLSSMLVNRQSKMACWCLSSSPSRRRLVLQIPLGRSSSKLAYGLCSKLSSSSFSKIPLEEAFLMSSRKEMSSYWLFMCFNDYSSETVGLSLYSIIYKIPMEFNRKSRKDVEKKRKRDFIQIFY